jgi:methyltransferase-like protein
MEIWIDGKLNMAPVTTTFTGSTSNFVGNTYFFGNNSSFTSAGSQIAAAITMNYWANSSEQIRLENFFRWYYGRKF